MRGLPTGERGDRRGRHHASVPSFSFPSLSVFPFPFPRVFSFHIPRVFSFPSRYVFSFPSRCIFPFPFFSFFPTPIGSTLTFAGAADLPGVPGHLRLPISNPFD